MNGRIALHWLNTTCCWQFCCWTAHQSSHDEDTNGEGENVDSLKGTLNKSDTLYLAFGILGTNQGLQPSLMSLMSLMSQFQSHCCCHYTQCCQRLQMSSLSLMSPPSTLLVLLLSQIVPETQAREEREAISAVTCHQNVSGFAISLLLLVKIAQKV